MTFNDQDKVIIVGGDLVGTVGHIYKASDTLPGTENITYVAPWSGRGAIAFNIPLGHLVRIDPQTEEL